MILYAVIGQFDAAPRLAAIDLRMSYVAATCSCVAAARCGKRSDTPSIGMSSNDRRYSGTEVTCLDRKASWKTAVPGIGIR